MTNGIRTDYNDDNDLFDHSLGLDNSNYNQSSYWGDNTDQFNDSNYDYNNYKNDNNALLTDDPEIGGHYGWNETTTTTTTSYTTSFLDLLYPRFGGSGVSVSASNSADPSNPAYSSNNNDDARGRRHDNSAFQELLRPKAVIPRSTDEYDDIDNLGCDHKSIISKSKSSLGKKQRKRSTSNTGNGNKNQNSSSNASSSIKKIDNDRRRKGPYKRSRNNSVESVRSTGGILSLGSKIWSSRKSSKIPDNHQTSNNDATPTKGVPAHYHQHHYQSEIEEDLIADAYGDLLIAEEEWNSVVSHDKFLIKKSASSSIQHGGGGKGGNPATAGPPAESLSVATTNTTATASSTSSKDILDPDEDCDSVKIESFLSSQKRQQQQQQQQQQQEQQQQWQKQQHHNRRKHKHHQLDKMKAEHNRRQQELEEEQNKERFFRIIQFTLMMSLMIILVCLTAWLMVFILRDKDAISSISNGGGDKYLSGSSSSNNRPVIMAPPTADCELVNYQKRPNALSQCYCENRIWKLSGEVKTRYDKLSIGFIRKLYPNFNDTISSCSPQNQALLWLAADGAVFPFQMQRYILSLLFIEWGGLEWSIFDHYQYFPTLMNNNHLDHTDGMMISHHGDNLHQKWLTRETECGWFGVTCNHYEEIIAFDLPNIQLQGSIPTELALLTSLQRLHLPENKIHGTLPEVLATAKIRRSDNNEDNPKSSSSSLALNDLSEIILFQNSISGTIPEVYFSAFTNLQIFNMDSNHIFGSIPTQIGYLTQLEQFKVTRNGITGIIPTEIGNLNNSLRIIELEDNAISGNALPSEIGKLQQLQSMNLNHNPSLDRSTIPNTFQQLSNLRALLLRSTNIVGTIPTFIGTHLLSMQHFDFGMNYISGTIPTEIAQLSNSIHYIQLDSNRIDGTIPKELQYCTGLRVLKVSYNQLHGTIPIELGSLSKLIFMGLEGNNIHGAMPSAVCDLRNHSGVLQSLSASCSKKLAVDGAEVDFDIENIFGIKAKSKGIECAEPDCCSSCLYDED